jgi:hypothetical protein
MEMIKESEARYNMKNPTGCKRLPDEEGEARVSWSSIGRASRCRVPTPKAREFSEAFVVTVMLLVASRVVISSRSLSRWFKRAVLVDEV